VSLYKFHQTPIFNVLTWSFIWALQILVSRAAFNNGIGLGSYITQTCLGTFALSLFILLPSVMSEAKELLRFHPFSFQLVILANFIHSGVAGVFYFTSLALTTATNVGFLSKLSIVSTLVLASIFLAEKLTHQKLFTLALMIIGAWLLIAHGQGLAIEPGALLIIVACVLWSIGNVIIKSQMKRTNISGELIAAFRPIVGSPTLVILAATIPIIIPELSAHFGGNYLASETAPYSIPNSFLTIGLTMFLYRSLRVSSAGYVALMSMTNPVIVTILGYCILGETLTSVQLLGGALIIVGGIWSQRIGSEKRDVV